MHTGASTATFPTDFTVPFDYTSYFWISDNEKLSINEVMDWFGRNERACWAIYIKRTNGTIDSKINTYALYESLGHTLGAGRIPNVQYDKEQEYKASILTNRSILLDDVQVGDTLTVMMCAYKGYKIVATRTLSDWDIKLFRHPKVGNRFTQGCSKCNETILDNKKACIYCFLGEKSVCVRPYTRFNIEDGLVSETYQIGYSDGYKGSDLPTIDWGSLCNRSLRKELIKMYKSGYDAGETKRVLENRTEGFCTLLPYFLAQK